MRLTGPVGGEGGTVVLITTAGVTAAESALPSVICGPGELVGLSRPLGVREVGSSSERVLS